MPDSNLIRKEKRSIQTEAWSWVKCILCGIVIALALDFLVIANARVPTGSMEDTIPVGARIIGLRHSYLFEEPQRGRRYSSGGTVSEYSDTRGLRTLHCPGRELFCDGR